VIAILLFIGAFTVLAKRIALLQSKHKKMQARLSVLEEQLLANQQELQEVRIGSIGMGDKIKALVTSVKQTASQQEQLASQDPQSRLYQQAAKMVASGYSVEDLMHECDMPKAEAELIYNLHKQ
jgi:flagellar biogenesis protein FliO